MLSTACACVLLTGGRSGGLPTAGVCDDGWTAVSRPPKSNIVDPSRLKITKREQVDDSQYNWGPVGVAWAWAGTAAAVAGANSRPPLKMLTYVSQTGATQTMPVLHNCSIH